MKDHAKQTKKMRAVVKKKSQAVDKLAKKARKKAGDAELAEEHEIKVRGDTRAVNDIVDSSLYTRYCAGAGPRHHGRRLGGQGEGRGQGHSGEQQHHSQLMSLSAPLV